MKQIKTHLILSLSNVAGEEADKCMHVYVYDAGEEANKCMHVYVYDVPSCTLWEERDDLRVMTFG